MRDDKDEEEEREEKEDDDDTGHEEAGENRVASESTADKLQQPRPRGTPPPPTLMRWERARCPRRELAVTSRRTIAQAPTAATTEANPRCVQSPLIPWAHVPNPR